MIVHFPLLIDRERKSKRRKDNSVAHYYHYSANLLFDPLFSGSGTSLQKIHSKLRTQLRRHFKTADKLDNHAAILGHLTYSPEIKSGKISDVVHLKRTTFEYKIFYIRFEAFGGKVAMFPHLGLSLIHI